MSRKNMRQLTAFLVGAVAVIMIEQFGSFLGGLLGKPVTYGEG